MSSKSKKVSKIRSYSYTGKDRRGKEISGTMHATSNAMARAELRRLGISPKKIHKKAKSLLSGSKKKITSKDITLFTRQMATMMKSGVALMDSFDIVGKGHEKITMQELLQEVKAEIETGTSFADALEKHPKYFDALYCNLIRAGEISGTLDKMLDRIALYKEKTESLKSKIKKALFYPIAVMVVAIAVTTILLLWVVPQFEALFQNFGADLPVFTQFVINLSVGLQTYWWLFILATIGIIAVLRACFKRSYHFRYFTHSALLKVYVVGDIINKSSIARYARTLSTTIAAGVPLLECLSTVAGATGNLVYTKAVNSIKDDVETGQQLQLAMRTTELFPNMVVQMVAIGEEAGSLESMLAKVADFYEEEVDDKVEGLSSLLEPIIIVILGVLIGGLIVAMYLPIFKMGSVVG